MLENLRPENLRGRTSGSRGKSHGDCEHHYTRCCCSLDGDVCCAVKQLRFVLPVVGDIIILYKVRVVIVNRSAKLRETNSSASTSSNPTFNSSISPDYSNTASATEARHARRVSQLTRSPQSPKPSCLAHGSTLMPVPSKHTLTPAACPLVPPVVITRLNGSTVAILPGPTNLATMLESQSRHDIYAASAAPAHPEMISMIQFAIGSRASLSLLTPLILVARMDGDRF